jgi:hypothetical protein
MPAAQTYAPHQPFGLRNSFASASKRALALGVARPRLSSWLVECGYNCTVLPNFFVSGRSGEWAR